MSENILPAPVEAAEIEKYLPHRYPFLLIDRVVHMELEPVKKLRAIKNVTMNEPHFQGHFPGTPIMPGVTIVEAMAQTAGVMLGVGIQSNTAAMMRSTGYHPDHGIGRIVDFHERHIGSALGSSNVRLAFRLCPEGSGGHPHISGIRIIVVNEAANDHSSV